MIYSCPHCRTQNFVTPARLRVAQRVPLQCWKCGQKMRKSFSRKGLGKKSRATGP